MDRRWIWVAALLCGVASAQGSDPFRGPTKVVKGSGGRIVARVPKPWTKLPVAGRQVLHLKAPGSGGGHDFAVSVDPHASDVNMQRSRYLAHDKTLFPGCTVTLKDAPFTGYRIDDEKKHSVLVRAFLGDGDDGIVITAASSLRMYDRFWARQIEAVVASVAVGDTPANAPAGGEAGAETGPHRVYGAEGRFSLVAPAGYHAVGSDDVHKVLVLKGMSGTVAEEVTVTSWGGPTTPPLVLTTLFVDWSKRYSGLSQTRLGDNPPRMLVHGRRAGQVDIVTGLADGKRGYSLSLSVPQASYEMEQGRPDAFLKTVVFEDTPYFRPATVAWAKASAPAGDLVRILGREEGGAKEAASLLSDFDKGWKKVAPLLDRKADPVQVLLVDAKDFAATAHAFGTPPAAYDRQAHRVVALPAPSAATDRASWTAAVYAALGEALLHRDLPGPAPAWYRAGLGACLEAWGRTGKSPEAPSAGAMARLGKLKKLPPLRDLLLRNLRDFAAAQDRANLHAEAWGYVHLMLFGGGRLHSLYRRWTHEFAGPRGAVHPFDPGGYSKTAEELQKHLDRMH